MPTKRLTGMPKRKSSVGEANLISPPLTAGKGMPGWSVRRGKAMPIKRVVTIAMPRKRKARCCEASRFTLSRFVLPAKRRLPREQPARAACCGKYCSTVRK